MALWVRCANICKFTAQKVRYYSYDEFMVTTKEYKKENIEINNWLFLVVSSEEIFIWRFKLANK